jgi:hypothetical protein
MGGHLGDRSRGGVQAQLHGLLERQGGDVRRIGRIAEATPPAGHPLRHALDLVRCRVRALRHALEVLPTELARRLNEERVLALAFDGDGLDQRGIAAAMGAPGRQWVNRIMAGIKAEASSPHAALTLAARCGRCGAEFPQRISEVGGRPRRFCKKSCGDAFKASAWRYRKRYLYRSKATRRRIPSPTHGA